MFYFIAILLILPLSAHSLAKNVKEKDKDCSKRDFDRKMSNVFGQFGPDDQYFPTNTQELKDYCREVKDAFNVSNKYSDECLTGTSQTLLNLGNYNFDKVNKQYCSKKGTKKNDFIMWSKCSNSAKKKLGTCWNKMIMDFAMVDKVNNTKSRIPIVCCTYYEWIRCTVNVLKEKSSNTCSEEAIAGYESHIRKSSVDAMNLICSKYQDDQVKCASLSREIPNAPKPKKLYKTPYLYIFKIFDNL